MKYRAVKEQADHTDDMIRCFILLDNSVLDIAIIVRIPDRIALFTRQMDNSASFYVAIIRISGISLKIWRIAGLAIYELSNTLKKGFTRGRYWIASPSAALELSNRLAERRIFKLI